MTSERRPQLAERRRRVIYAHGLEPGGAVSAKKIQRFRQARRPTSAYGARVHRRLRARWFGLVPVRRRTMAAVVAVLLVIGGLLTLAHYAAIAWPSLAYQEPLARPLRLDRSDSFGSWLAALLWATAAGIALLIYQLRRYRSDDFEGRYRLWRPVMLITLLVSLNSITGLVDWSGRLIDALVGRRAALAGSDWLWLGILVGGTALLLRLVREVWQSRLATASLLAGGLFLGFPALVRWQFISIDSLLAWALLHAAGLLAAICCWIGLLAYLRVLYRDVRQIEENDRLADRMRSLAVVQWWQQREARRSERAASRAASKQEKADAIEAARAEKRAAAQQAKADQAARKAEAAAQKEAEAEARRAQRREAKLSKAARSEPAGAQAGNAAGPEAAESDSQESQAGGASTARRSLWKRLGRKRAGASASAAESGEPPSKGAEPSPQDADKDSQRNDPAAPRKKRFGLGWRVRKKGSDGDGNDETDTEVASTPAAKTATSPAVAKPNPEATDEEAWIDPDSIDWDSLNKAERRRLRRQLKRQNRAA